ncbi:ABC transporter permease [Sulfobacillus harzensis]|uniref:ABC transporter permease n=1 Tax=Sulfobacillus harzensis TaxID=2729629 RepID=A0A7Y0L4A2_9FIRM|nr:ABC transporter permease [Sulfobacillus harzensis]NMP22813.1 ABC transporter permease [Sulfobacillus harzensis]
MSAQPEQHPGSPSQRSQGGEGGILRVLRYREASIGLVAVALIVIFQVLSAQFLTLGNLQVAFQLAAEIAIVGVAEVMVMVLGEIDLSVGNVFAFAPVVMYFINQAGVPLVVAILVALAASLAVGFINGVLTVKVGVPSFIATLAVLYALNGLTLIITNGFPVTPPSTLLTTIMGGGTYSIVAWAVIIVVIWHFILNKTPFGLHTTSVGSNLIASREVGIAVDRVKIWNFVLASGLSGLLGIIEGFRISSIDPLAGGTGLLLEGIAAAVIGGTALTGGSGTIIGAAIGAFVIAALQEGLNLLGVNAYYFDLVLGLAIGVAMILNIRMSRVRKGAGRSG